MLDRSAIEDALGKLKYIEADGGPGLWLSEVHLRELLKQLEIQDGDQRASSRPRRSKLIGEIHHLTLRSFNEPGDFELALPSTCFTSTIPPFQVTCLEIWTNALFIGLSSSAKFHPAVIVESIHSASASIEGVWVVSECKVNRLFWVVSGELNYSCRERLVRTGEW